MPIHARPPLRADGAALALHDCVPRAWRDESGVKPESTREIPQAAGLDATAALYTEGYTFISSRCERLHSDVFQTRLLLRPTLCMRGADAAALFYDEDLFQRRGAMPRRVRRTLFRGRSVQELDDEPHRRRKALFLSLLGPEAIRELCTTPARVLGAAAVEWETRDEIVLLDEIQRVLCRAAADWTGVSMTVAQVSAWTRDLEAMLEASGRIGLGHWRGRIARARRARELAALIDDVRTGIRLTWPYGPLGRIAAHRDAGDALLSTRVAASELLNVLRPTVAVAWWVALSVLALHEHPRAAEAVRGGGERELEHFVQEVRRFYPFFPFVAARTRRRFQWNGYAFPAGRRVLLDLHGTNRDARVWTDPDAFQPERFRRPPASPYAFVPQGGGDAATGHRCPGENLSTALTQVIVSRLCRDMTYTVPDQDLTLPPRPPPTPRSRLRIRDVRVVSDG